MIALVKRFAASPASGYILIALLVAAAGLGVWFWSELKEFGALSERADNQAARIEYQQAELSRLSTEIERRQATLTNQANRTTQLQRTARELRQEIEEARREAPQDYLACRDIIVPERLRFGASRESSEGEAGQ